MLKRRSRTNGIPHDYKLKQNQDVISEENFYVLRHLYMRNDGKSIFIRVGKEEKSMEEISEGEFSGLGGDLVLVGIAGFL